MALKKKPVTGMKDILPKEMEIRNYVMNMIRETYGTFGFSSIETPCVEHIENLSSKQGGENEKLIFKILKRGEKLKLAELRGQNDLDRHPRQLFEVILADHAHVIRRPAGDDLDAVVAAAVEHQSVEDDRAVFDAGQD